MGKSLSRLERRDMTDIVTLCQEIGSTLVDVQHNVAISKGLVDVLADAGLRVIGPTKKAAEIEWSKEFEREFGVRHGLRQPGFAVFNSEEEGVSHVKKEEEVPRFIKADGIYPGGAAVIPAKDRSEAIEAIRSMGGFKKAGSTYLIERWLRNLDGTNGEEFSAFAISDGADMKILGSAQDHKRLHNFDLGRNTGGIGCVTPPLVLTDGIYSEINQNFETVIKGLAEEGRPYRGVLYKGGILIREEEGLVMYDLEFNSRWGNPEASVIVPGIQNDFFELSSAALDGNLRELNVTMDGKTRVVVSGVAADFVGDAGSVKGKQIFGLEEARRTEGVTIHGGSMTVEDGKYYVSGERLFYVVGEGKDVIEARKRAYTAMSAVFIEGNRLHFRTDIGWRDLERLVRY